MSKMVHGIVTPLPVDPKGPYFGKNIYSSQWTKKNNVLILLKLYRNVMFVSQKENVCQFKR